MADDDKPIDLAVHRNYREMVKLGEAFGMRHEAEMDQMLFKLFGFDVFRNPNNYTARDPTKEECKRFGKNVSVYYHKDRPDCPRFVVSEHEAWLVTRDAETNEELKRTPVHRHP